MRRPRLLSVPAQFGRGDVAMEALFRTIDRDGHAPVLVELDVSAAAAEDAQLELAGLFLDPATIGERGVGPMLPSDIVRAHRARARTPRVRVFGSLGLALGRIDRRGAEALLGVPGINAVLRVDAPSLVRPVRIGRVLNHAGAVSWGLDRLGARALWTQGARGQGVLVGHVDTGVDDTHPALAGAVSAFTEFAPDGSERPGARAWDAGDHGTHTAGTIAGRPGAFGTFGVAPEAMLASALVTDGSRAFDAMVGAIEWAVRKGARIVTASFGFPRRSPAMQLLVDALRRRDILPVFAVGNDGEDASRSPGNCEGVLSLGAGAEDDHVAPFSGSHRFHDPDRRVPDLVAPGVGIRSCVPDGGFAFMSGSTVAAAHVAGLAALLLSARPASSVDAIEAVIRGSARLPSTMSVQRANRGVPDGPRALAML